MMASIHCRSGHYRSGHCRTGITRRFWSGAGSLTAILLGLLLFAGVESASADETPAEPAPAEPVAAEPVPAEESPKEPVAAEPATAEETASKPTEQAGEQLPKGAKLVGIESVPAEIQLVGPFAFSQLLITGQLEDGRRVDVTRMVQCDLSEELVSLSDRRLVRPLKDGQAQLHVSLGEQSLDIPVTVRGFNDAVEPNFVTDVQPVLSKMGCNAGTCHGSAKGKNGFKLSLRGYDARFDHIALTDDLAARRINRSAPEQSLMLVKPSGEVPHEGGDLMRPGDPYYEIVRSWIAAGVKLETDVPRVQSIDLMPKNPGIPLPGMKQQIVVTATYSDGSVRDVTADAFLESSLSEVAEVDRQGLVTGVRRGEAAMLARYEGNYAATRVVVMGDREGFQWEAPPTHGWIDELVYKKLQAVKVSPAELCTDAEFIRRIYLDLTGAPPQPEQVRAFLADTRETREKRDALIEELLASDAHIEFITNKWSDLLQVNRKFLNEKGAWAFRSWIRQAVSSNMPYDQFVHSILTASGSTYQNPPASYYRVLRTPEDVMENSTQLFLGVRFNCNKCHDHPFERWTQDQYYDLAAYFARVGRKPGSHPDEEVIFDTRGGGEVTHVGTGQVAPPEFPYEHGDVAEADANRREAFAHWVTSKDNQYFATSYVNRLWAYMLGVGLIDPIDDIRAGNPPSNPELLNRLTQEFIDSGFDRRHMIRLICQSRVYQHSLNTNPWNEDDEINFAHAIARRLPAEVLYDAVHMATGSPLKLPGLPKGSGASQLPDSTVKVSGGFLDLFGRPPRESACECERSTGVSLAQALNLVNGPTIAEAITHDQNRIARLVRDEPDDRKLVDELFVAILCRPATEQELETGIGSLTEAESRLIGAQDLAWALLNSPSFLFNR
jgi:hypothetical protein